MADQATVAVTKRPKGRSPAYPSINLETAIRRARQLYEKERHHPTPVATIVAHWDYASLNGPAAGALAALKKFGLLDDEGAGPERRARISALADVIIAHPDEAASKAAIQEAALRPPIHRELWEKYHNDLPSDRNLRWELTHERGFTETGANEFIPVYRATIAYAQLANDAYEPGPELDNSELELDNGKREDLKASSGSGVVFVEAKQPLPVTRSYPIPLIEGGAVVVEGTFPITEQDWDQFIRVLTAMKPGLVKATSGPDAAPRRQSLNAAVSSLPANGTVGTSRTDEGS